MAARPIVHVVDDDERMRKSLGRLLEAAGHAVALYASAEALLEAAPTGPGCLLLDLRMPGTGGVALQERLATGASPLPVVFLTGHGDIPTTVRAMRSGAVDVLTKPASAQALLGAIGRALARDAEQRAARDRLAVLRARYQTLTQAERTVLSMVVSGRLNKQIAYDLGRAERTVKAHRSRVMEKLRANSVADLVRMATELGVEPAPLDEATGAAPKTNGGALGRTVR
jgi:FixJ family two-component response regulator